MILKSHITAILGIDTLAPQLLSLIKLPKMSYPLRPVESFFSTPSYKALSFLLTLFQFSIRNANELMGEIKEIYLLSNIKLISLIFPVFFLVNPQQMFGN